MPDHYLTVHHIAHTKHNLFTTIQDCAYHNPHRTMQFPTTTVPYCTLPLPNETTINLTLHDLDAIELHHNTARPYLTITALCYTALYHNPTRLRYANILPNRTGPFPNVSEPTEPRQHSTNKHRITPPQNCALHLITTSQHKPNNTTTPPSYTIPGPYCSALD